ncbi:TIGR04255 family protein [Mariprofundus erugo]|uniref:TIGR04255 family protein n=1 Tax=Mariprofundus erugo TaxID=2528639 RepID=UPI0010FD1438|nr:TIGR04255 family protein [Mariprofundus erugo]TLS77624.1 TIGR04255 family protein [Mariprofundus erugo]
MSADMKQLPEKLGKAPLVERVFELRFETRKQGVAEILPGLFYKALEDYSNIETLPVVSVPKEIRDREEKFKFLPHYQLSGDNRRILVGERSILFSETRPDGQWNDFCQELVKITDAFFETNLAETVSRFSLKTLNLLEDNGSDELDRLNLDVKVGGVKASPRGFHLRTELVTDERTITILQVVASGVLEMHGGPIKKGTLIEVDSIRDMSAAEGFLANRESLLNDLHDVQKQHFFGLLDEKTLATLEPKWGAA